MAITLSRNNFLKYHIEDMRRTDRINWMAPLRKVKVDLW